MADETINALAIQVSMDDSSFSQGKANLLNQMKVIDSEFKSSIAGVKNWGSSLDALKGNATALGDKINVQKQIIQAYSDQLGKSNTALDKNSQKVTDNKVKFDAAKVAYEESTTALGKNADETKALKVEMDKAESALKSSEGLVRSNNKAVQDSTVGYNNATGSLSKMESELSQTNAKIADSTSKLTKMEASLTGVGKGIQGISEKATSVGTALTVGVTAPIIAMGAAAVKAFDEVDEGADAAMAKTGLTGDAAVEMEQSYKKVASGINADFTVIGSALGEVNIRLGFTGDKLETAGTDFLKFARINKIDATQAIQLVSRAMGDAGIKTDDYKSVLDKLTAASQASGISIDVLTGDITKYGAPMRALGMDTSDSIAIFSTWEKAGVNTEIAFAGMKKAIGTWGKANKDPREEFKKTLKEIKDSPDIAKATTKAIEIFGQKAGPDLADAIKGGRFAYEDFLKVLSGSKGTIENTYSTIIDGVDDSKVAIQKAKIVLSDFGNTILKAAAPLITKVSDKITELTDKFEKLTPAQQENIIKMAGIVAAAGPVIAILGKVGSGIGGVFTATGSAVGGIKDFIGGLKGIAPVAGEALSGASTLGAALGTLSGGTVALGIAAIGLAVAGVSAALIEAGTPTLNMIKSIDDETESYAELKKTQADSVASDLAQIDRTKELYDELKTIVSANGDVKKGYEDRATFIVGELNKAVGTEMKINDGVIKGYKDTATAIDNLIKKQKLQILLDADKPVYAKALTDLQKAENQQVQLAIDLADQKIKVANAQKDVENTAYNEDASHLQGRQAALASEKSILGDKQVAYDKNRSNMKQYHTDINGYETASAATTKGSYDEAKVILDQYGVKQVEATGTHREQLAAQALSTQQHLAEVRKEFKEGWAGVTSDSVKQAADAATKASTDFLKIGNDAGKSITLGLDSQGALIYTSGANAGTQVVSGANSVDYAKYGSTSGSVFGEAFGTAIKSTKLPQIKVNWVTESKSSQSNAGKLASYSFPNIKWAANGGVFDHAEVIGIGERGREAALPLNNTIFMEIAQGIIKNLKFPSLNSLANSVSQSTGSAQSSALSTSTAQAVSSALKSGDITVIQQFTGKTPSAAETARQTKNGLRRLALNL